MKIASIILAAGLSERFGNIDKLTYVYNGKPLLLNVINALKLSPALEIYSVLPKGNVALSKLCARENVTPIFNPDLNQGQGHSLSLGVKVVMEKGYDAALITLGDMPNVSPEHIGLLMKNAVPSGCVFSENKGAIMPPCIIPKAYFPKLSTLSGDQGARAVLSDDDIEMTLPLSDFEAKDIDRLSDLPSL